MNDPAAIVIALFVVLYLALRLMVAGVGRLGKYLDR